MEKFPKVFIIILNYNGKAFITSTLNSVFKLNYLHFEVILTDNDSNDGSFESSKKLFPRAIFIKNSANLGFASGNNVGVKYALERGADYIWLLNYDTQVKKNSLSILVEEMEKDKTIGLASPLIKKGNTDKNWFSGGKINWLKMKAVHEEKELEENYFHSDFISGCAVLIRAEVFKKIGLLDEDYFLYWEDADFSLKAKRAGYRLLISPKSKIFHLEISEKKKAAKIYWLVVSGLIFFQKNSPLWLRPYIFIYILLRKIKNYFDFRFRYSKTAEMVRQAYKDFAKYV